MVGTSSGPHADWFGLYRRDIEAFRALRNTVVHAPGNVSDDEVRSGVELGSRLLASYRRFLDRGSQSAA
jgi:hypothetical protein